MESSPSSVGLNADASLEVRGLECIRDDRVLFSDLDFTLSAGQMLQVEGRNGAGKTTLLRILCGLRLPDEGELFWCGESMGRLGPDYRQHVAYIGHLSGLKRELTARENLGFARGLGVAVDGADVDEVLEKVGLFGFEDVPVRALSAGQTRRVALARLLLTESQLWILDEPFTAIDRDGIRMIEGLLDWHTARGGMIALTTHHRIDMAQERVIHLNLTDRLKQGAVA